MKKQSVFCKNRLSSDKRTVSFQKIKSGDAIFSRSFENMLENELELLTRISPDTQDIVMTAGCHLKDTSFVSSRNVLSGLDTSSFSMILDHDPSRNVILFSGETEPPAETPLINLLLRPSGPKDWVFFFPIHGYPEAEPSCEDEDIMQNLTVECQKLDISFIDFPYRYQNAEITLSVFKRILDSSEGMVFVRDTGIFIKPTPLSDKGLKQRFSDFVDLCKSAKQDIFNSGG